jgi:hypothetical protein
MDGYGFDGNKFRYSSKELYKRSLDNLKLYINQTETIPLVKLTVNPENAHLFYENVKALLANGLDKIQILPAFGVPWNNVNKKHFLDNFNLILKLHCYLKSRNTKISLDPIDWYIQMIQQNNFSRITHNNCDIGDQISFTPSGQAYACLAMIHLNGNSESKKKFYLGSIHKKIDIDKMRSLGEYRICRQIKGLDCKYHFPNISCKKIYATFDFKTGKRLESKYIDNLNEIENYMFHKTYDFYFNVGK